MTTDDRQIIITVASTNGVKFVAYLGGRLLCQRTYTPLLDAARILLAEGYSSSTVLVMRHSGSATDSLTTTIGEAAKLTVEEGPHGPQFRRYRPRHTPVEASYSDFADGEAARRRNPQITTPSSLAA